MREPNAPEAVPAAGVALSQREVDAMLVLEGKTYVEIGRTHLRPRPSTVEHHVAHMRRRPRRHVAFGPDGASARGSRSERNAPGTAITPRRSPLTGPQLGGRSPILSHETPS